jgi:hypothetical protein
MSSVCPIACAKQDELYPIHFSDVTSGKQELLLWVPITALPIATARAAAATRAAAVAPARVHLRRRGHCRQRHTSQGDFPGPSNCFPDP